MATSTLTIPQTLLRVSCCSMAATFLLDIEFRCRNSRKNFFSLSLVLALKLIIEQKALLLSSPLKCHAENKHHYNLQWTCFLIVSHAPPRPSTVDSRVTAESELCLPVAFILSWPFKKECCQQIIMVLSSFTTNYTFQQGVRYCFISYTGHLDLVSHSQVINFLPRKGHSWRLLSSEGNIWRLPK